MNSYQLFAGRAYVFNESSEVDEDSKEYEFVYKLTKKFRIPFLMHSLKSLEGTEDFDCYELKSLGKTYTLKVSFDSSNKELKNETFIFKNNRSVVIPEYIDSGEVVVGQPVMFLLTKNSNLKPLDDWGFSYPTKSIHDYMSSLNTFSNLDCELSFRDYCSRLLDKVNPEKWSEFVRKSIFSFYESKKIIPIYNSLKRELESNFDNDILKKDSVVNPRAGFQNIKTDGVFFEFGDCGECFLSNEILGICFFSLNFGLNKKSTKKILKIHCKNTNIDFKSIKKEFKLCLKVACCIFLFDCFYRFIIEECIFESSRPKNIINMNIIMSRCLDNCSCLSCYDDIRLTIKSIFIRPIIEDREDNT